MSQITIEMPDDFSLNQSQKNISLQAARVVQAVAGHFNVDVQIRFERNAEGYERLAFAFAGGKALQARACVNRFLRENPSVESCLVAPDAVPANPEADWMLDVDSLLRLKPEKLETAVSEATRFGFMHSRSNQQLREVTR